MADNYTLSIDVLGMQELEDKLMRMGEVGKQALAGALNKTAIDLETEIKSSGYTPHKTGNLDTSFSPTIQEATSSNLAAIVGTNVKYARAQEFGTVGMVINSHSRRGKQFSYIGNIKPKFYVKKSLETVKTKMTEHLHKALQKIVDA